MYPTTFELELAFQERSTLCCIEATPLPLSDSVAGEFAALLTKERLAVAVPEAWGRKVTVKGIDWPAARVVGSEIPLRTNSALVLVAEEIVTEEPLALSMPGKDAGDPVLTLPKFKAKGDSVNCPAVFPFPDRGMLSCGFEAFERIARFPEIEPQAVGAKTTLKVKLCPAPRIVGRDKPLAVNAALDEATCEMVTLAVPVLVSVSVKV